MPVHTSRPGLKRHRVDVQEYAITRSDEGDTIRTWTSKAFWWAEIRPLRGIESEQADQQKAIKTHRVFMRFFTPGVSEIDRVIFNSRIFNIVTVINPGERGCDTVLDVKEAGLAT